LKIKGFGIVIVVMLLSFFFTTKDSILFDSTTECVYEDTFSQEDKDDKSLDELSSISIYEDIHRCSFDIKHHIYTFEYIVTPFRPPIFS